MIRRLQGWDLGRGVAAFSLQQRQRSDINMSSSKRRDCEIRKLLTIIGEKVMQSHLMQTGKDGAIYEKVPEELCLGGFCWDKKSGQQNKEYLAVFALVNS